MTQWNVRSLKLDVNADDIVAINGTEFTPVAGEYQISIRATAYPALRLVEVETGATLIDSRGGELQCFQSLDNKRYRIEKWNTDARKWDTLPLDALDNMIIAKLE